MTLETRRLLVVDDEPFNLEIIAEHLEADGYELVTAADGEQAWEILESASADAFDVLILDRMMPRLDGLALLIRMKAQARYQHLPVIMQTAAASKEQVVEGIRNGAYYYLTKPFDGEVLATVVRTAVADRSAWREMSRAASLEPQSLRLIAEARFRLRSLADARQLATALASCFPDQPGVALGFLELFVNAVEHGNLGITLADKAALLKAGTWEAEIERRLEEPANRDKRVEVHFGRDAGCATVHVKDEGIGFDWRPFLELDPQRAFEPNGRGIALARRLGFGDMEYLGSGNEVRVVFPLKQ
jgi:DNA-binding response OmpR family regulator